jgi:hypothetical protein
MSRKGEMPQQVGLQLRGVRPESHILALRLEKRYSSYLSMLCILLTFEESDGPLIWREDSHFACLAEKY